MKLDQLRVFVAVAEAGHVTRAARSLGMTQSAASAAIAALEARYGASLFHRVGRGIELSETGRRFLPEARAVLDRAAVARAVLQDMSDLAAGSLAIAASQTIASHWLPRRLAAYHTAYPGVKLDVTIGNTRQVEAAVVEGAADLGLVEGPTHLGGLIRSHVDHDRPVLVVAAGYPPLPETEPGRLDLRAISWVVRETGSGTRVVLEELAKAEGLSFDDLRVFLVLPANEAVREAVEAGAGATIISEHVVASALAKGDLRSIAVDLPRREFALVRHRDRPPSAALRALIAELKGDGGPGKDRRVREAVDRGGSASAFPPPIGEAAR